MRVPLSLAALAWLVAHSTSGGAQVTRLEAEQARLEGPSVHVARPAAAQPASASAALSSASSGMGRDNATSNDEARLAHATGFTGDGFVTGFDTPEDRVVFTYQAPRAGVYELRISYRSNAHRGYQLQVNDLRVDGTFLPSAGDAFAVQQAGRVELQAGVNTLAIGGGWRHYDIDAIEVTPSSPYPAPAKLAAMPSDPAATPEARALMAKVDGVYGRGALMGVYSDEDAQYVEEQTGTRPAILGADFSGYSPASAERSTRPNDTAERMIERARQGYIVTLSWHWVPPFGLLNRMLPAQNGKPEIDARWNKGFYTNATNFDVSIAMNDPQSLERADLLRDIDAIAVQLKKFQSAGVPILWRPLHEAQGGWFWWGARGPEPFVALWRLMYDRLVRVDGVHNLVWVYTSADDPAWYPGDAYVDVVGIDAYPKDLEDPQSELWAELSAQFAGRKPLAISEFGGVPDVERMQRLGIDWAYAVSWSREEGPRKNTPEALKRIYAGTGALKMQPTGARAAGK